MRCISNYYTHASTIRNTNKRRRSFCPVHNSTPCQLHVVTLVASENVNLREVLPCKSLFDLHYFVQIIIQCIYHILAQTNAQLSKECCDYI